MKKRIKVIQIGKEEVKLPPVNRLHHLYRNPKDTTPPNTQTIIDSKKVQESC
jgi:hypothetical protein